MSGHHHLRQIDPDATDLAAAVASLASTAAALSSQAQRVAEMLAADHETSPKRLALLPEPEALMDEPTEPTMTMTSSAKPLLLTAAEVAGEFRIGIRKLQRMRAASEGPKAIKIGRAVRYRRRDIERWVEGKRS